MQMLQTIYNRIFLSLSNDNTQQKLIFLGQILFNYPLTLLLGSGS